VEDYEGMLLGGFWPDAYTAMMMNAAPDSRLFSELVAMAMRAELDVPDKLIAAADIGSVMHEEGISSENLADDLHVPPIYAHACARGWHRLGLRGLALVAESLRVPLSAFYFSPDGSRRPNVRNYLAYRIVAPRVTILGGE
jgi:hypothetical protein